MKKITEQNNHKKNKMSWNTETEKRNEEITENKKKKIEIDRERSSTQNSNGQTKKKSTEKTCREKERGGHTKTFARALGAIIQVASKRKNKMKWIIEARQWNSPKMNKNKRGPHVAEMVDGIIKEFGS